MSEHNLGTCLAFIFGEEGGYTDDPMDPSGATNLGITLDELNRWRHTAVTKDDVRDLQKAEATAIYTSNYWNVIQGAALPSGIDLMMLDSAVNMTPPRAARMLQKIVGTDADGFIGPVTIAATLKQPAADVINQFVGERVAFHQALPTFSRFGAGWLARTDRAKAQALQLAGQAGEPD